MPALIVLTQAAESALPLARTLAHARLEVECWPLVRLAPVPVEVIRPVLERLADYHWILLPSPAAVRLVAQQMKSLAIGWPADARAGLVGPGSVEAFRECFGSSPAVDTPPQPPYDASHLVRTLADVDDASAGPSPRRALVLNRPDGRTGWVQALRQKMEKVDIVPAYTAETILDGPPVELMWRLQRRQRAGAAVAWVVGANSQLDTLLQVLPEESRDWARRQAVLVPHAAILAHAQACGFEEVAVYDDRRDLLERLQYLGSDHDRTPGESADTDDDRKELSALSLDQQNDSAVPGAGLTDQAGSAARATPASSSAASAKPPAAPGAALPPAPAPSPESTSPSSPARSSSPAPVPVPAMAPAASLPPSSRSGPATPAASKAVPPAPTPPTPLSSPTPPPPPPFSTPPAAAGSRRGAGLWVLLAIILAGLLAAGGWWYTQQRFLATERDNARRVQEADARAGRLEEQIKTLRDAQNQLLSRSSTLESKLAESATQQEQLASLYEEIAKSRGDSALSEVEQSVQMANQHLELTGNVQAALLALQNAERRLGDSEQSQAIGVRRLILQDIERLKALPEIDLTRSAARLDEIIDRIDRLPLLADAGEAAQQPASPAASADVNPPVAATAAAPSSPSGAPAAGASTVQPGETAAGGDSTVTSMLKRFYAWVLRGGARSMEAVREEFRTLVAIRRIDKPDSLLLSPEQKHAARENLKLLLLNARLNLLNRHEELFRQDLGRVVTSMQRLYDSEQHDVKSAIATLQSLQAQPLARSLPSLAESLAAVKAARAASEKRS